MATYFINNLDNPVTSAHPAGIRIDAIGMGEALAEFAGIIAPVVGERLTIINADAIVFYQVGSTPTFTTITAPALPPEHS